MEKQGLRLSARYSKILTIFGALIAFGGAAGDLATTKTVFGGILIVIGLVAIGLAADGRRMTARVHSRLDLVIQAVMLGLPIVFVVMLAIALGGSLLRPFLGYILAYLGALIVVALMAVQELRKGKRLG